MDEIDLQSVLQEINDQSQPTQRDSKEALRKRQLSCRASQLNKQLLPENYKVLKKNQLSLSKIASMTNSRISKAAKQTLFGDLTQDAGLCAAPIVQLTQLRVVTEKEPLIFDLRNRSFKEKIHVRIKEGTIYNVDLKFIVHNDMVCGLRAVNTVSRMFARVQQEQTIGTFAPKKTQQVASLEQDQAPEGFFLRGDYKGKLLLIDAEGNVHCQLSYKLVISKDWS